MKIQATIDIDVVMGGVSHDRTGLQGYLPEGTRYEDIVQVFGEPQFGKSLDGKIQVEWVGRINGLVFTIYDYKSRIEPERNTDWHIGGRIKFVDILVNRFYENN
ncbi:MAG: hypothetical protein JNN05_02495 [Candidatus Omnitrophica bacterium]|nr:hypothetical protein [Candidatus Omnitrophota bacterium]